MKSGTIINGAQTVGTIINTLKNIEESERQNYLNSFVFVKIVSFTNDEKLVNDMVYTLNTQNQMKNSYSISNDPIVKKVQEKINKDTEFFLEIKNNEFNFEKVKNNNFNKLTKNKIDIETFIQVYVAFYNISNLANLTKNNKASLFDINNIEKVINDLNYEKAIRVYKIYLQLMDIIKDYRAYRKNRDKKDILNILGIKEDEIDEYRYLNTGNFIIMYALGIANINKNIEPEGNIITIIKFLKDKFKDESNISNATKTKESFEQVKEFMKKFTI